MLHRKSINLLGILILILSVFACILGLTMGGKGESYDFISIGGETVRIFGSGLYKNDSISVVAQGKASDLVTLVLAIPLLLGSLIYANKGSIKARLLLTGTLGYFLYTYMSYTFLWTYNPMFIVYVALMSASFYALTLSILSFDIPHLPNVFSDRLPVKFLGGFQGFIAFAIAMLWLGKIAPSILGDAIPLGLEHYTTLVIQGMDLGFIVPTATLSAILLIKRKPLGYLLTSIVVIKGITMLTCISAMIVNSILSGIDVSIVEVVLFFGLNIVSVFTLVLLLTNIKTTEGIPNEI